MTGATGLIGRELGKALAGRGDTVDQALDDLLAPLDGGVRVLGMSTPAIGDGTLIEYRLKPIGIAIAWQTRIDDRNPPHRFIDVQVKGLYAPYKRIHDFVAMGGGTLMRDTVRYRLRAGWFGPLTSGSKIASDVELIFDYHSRKIDERFSASCQ
jgi:ligand-binding SRPBCC domain-containing protein